MLLFTINTKSLYTVPYLIVNLVDVWGMAAWSVEAGLVGPTGVLNLVLNF
eukprot:SAG31_NODE_14457_length_805_cov_1.311615_1_plen_50_part_00